MPERQGGCGQFHYPQQGFDSVMSSDGNVLGQHPWALQNYTLAATLFAAQLKQPVERPFSLSMASGKNPALGVKPAKSKRKDPISALQKQVDELTGSMQHLTVANEMLQKKEKVLDLIIRAVDHVEQFLSGACKDTPPASEGSSSPASSVHTSGSPCPHDPTSLPECFKSMTTDEFISIYKSNLQKSSHWVLEAEGGATQEILDKLRAINNNTFEAVFCVGVCQPELLPKVRTELLNQFPVESSEEEHWLAMVQATALTPQQEEVLLIAQEIFNESVDRVAKEASDLSTTLQATTLHPPVALRTGSSLSLEDKDALVGLIAANLGKYHKWLLLLTCVVFCEVLDPLQTARCALHSHPLIPSALIFIHAVSCNVKRRNGSASPAAPVSSCLPTSPAISPSASMHLSQPAAMAAAGASPPRTSQQPTRLARPQLAHAGSGTVLPPASLSDAILQLHLPQQPRQQELKHQQDDKQQLLLQLAQHLAQQRPDCKQLRQLSQGLAQQHQEQQLQQQQQQHDEAMDISTCTPPLNTPEPLCFSPMEGLPPLPMDPALTDDCFSVPSLLDHADPSALLRQLQDSPPSSPHMADPLPIPLQARDLHSPPLYFQMQHQAPPASSAPMLHMFQQQQQQQQQAHYSPVHSPRSSGGQLQFSLPPHPSAQQQPLQSAPLLNHSHFPLQPQSTYPCLTQQQQQQQAPLISQAQLEALMLHPRMLPWSLQADPQLQFIQRMMAEPCHALLGSIHH